MTNMEWDSFFYRIWRTFHVYNHICVTVHNAVSLLLHYNAAAESETFRM